MNSLKRLGQLGLVALLTAILATSGSGSYGDDNAQPPDSYSQGEYMGHKWYIDENHMIFWDDEPYIRYSFTGSPRLDQLEEFFALGIDQFNVLAGEEKYVFENDPAVHQQNKEEIDAFTTAVTELGGNYYAGLNTLLPWKTSGKIADASRVPWVERGFTEVTEYAGTTAAVSISVFAPEDLSDYTDEVGIEVYLYDFTAATRTDLSDKILSVEWEDRGEGEGDEADTRYAVVIQLEAVDFPSSERLVIAASVPTSHETVFAYDMPAMWKNDVQDYFKTSLEFFADAYRKEGLRGMYFCDEIALWDTQPFMWGAEDFNRDREVMEAYHAWLAEEYNGDITALNADLGTSFSDFDEVPWYTTPLPYEGLEHLREVGELFGVYPSIRVVETIHRLQNDFRFDFYGSWYAKYSEMAKEIIGNVPVFTTVWSSQGTSELRLHRRAMIHGIDGLARNSYGTVALSERLGYITIGGQDLKGIEEYLDETVAEAGRTKAYFANEFYWLSEESGDREGERFKFPAKAAMKEFLQVMIEYGYTGFHLFIINPSEIWGSKENGQREDMQWFIELKDEVVDPLSAR